MLVAHSRLDRTNYVASLVDMYSIWVLVRGWVNAIHGVVDGQLL